MQWAPDRWRLYRLALGEALRALRAGLGLVLRAPRRWLTRTPQKLLFAPQDLRTSDPTIAGDIYAGLFVFAGRALTTGGRSPFQFIPPSPLWGETLYGFGWLRHLRAADTALARANARSLVREFLDQGRDVPALARHTNVAARRVIAFLAQSPLLLDGADHEFYRRFMRTLDRTLRSLENHVRDATTPYERLLVAIALCYAGLCCDRCEGRLRAATRHLTRELDRQILPDGGHVSRNPRLLIDLLLELLPLRQIYATRGIEPPKALVGAIDRMLPMLRMFRHGDGGLAHFNGMSATPVDHVATILIYDDARAQPIQRAPHSGYERLQAGSSLLIVDVGPAPPLHDSCDAHAGCLSFEFSSGAHRIVVNCGVPAWGDAAVKLVGRATAAHSTAMVAETSSCRFLLPQTASRNRWVAQWVQRRLGAAVLHGPTTVPVQRNEGSDAIELRASHDGYRASFGLVHERRWQLSADGGELHGQDLFILQREGAEPHDVAIRFHLHPMVEATTLEGGRARLRLPNQETWLFETSLATLRLEESVFFATMDRPRKTEQIVLAFNTRETSRVRWRFERLASGADAKGRGSSPVH